MLILILQINVKYNYRVRFYESFFYFRKIHKRLVGFLLFFSFLLVGEVTALKQKSLTYFSNLSARFFYSSLFKNSNQTQPLYSSSYDVNYNKLVFSDYSFVMLWPAATKHLISPFFKKFSVYLTTRKCFF